MNVAKLIADKRDGSELEADSIRELILGYAAGKVPDYQMSAFAMAVYFQGMSMEETIVLTQSMIDSGEKLSWPSNPPCVDKHSTGGIGDKISIPLAPLLACCGVTVPMISGRGLGATGGTLDKLESIPGYRCEVSNDEFRSIVAWNQCSISSASGSLAPADKKLYALRDVTGTIPSVPLITGSILSKKIAEGIDALILDVKWGSGAFMKSLDQAKMLAKTLVGVGKGLGVNTTALVTDMNQPLGRMIGNAVEIDESVDMLSGAGPEDANKLMFALGAQLLVQANVCPSVEIATDLMKTKIETGEALDRLREMVKSHGGNLDEPRKKANASEVKSLESGFVSKINAERLGLAVIEMGGGRKLMGDKLDHSVGIEFLVKIGDQVEQGDTIARVFCEGSAAAYANELVGASVSIAPDEVPVPELIVEAFD